MADIEDPEKTAAVVVAAVVEETLRNVFAPWVRELELRLIAASPGEVRLALPVHARHVHAGLSLIHI